MFITEDEMNRRLTSAKNIAVFTASSVPVISQTVPFVPPVAFPVADKKADEDTKVLGASLVRQGVSAQTVCKEFNITPKDLLTADQQRVQTSIDKIRELALDRLMISLGLMTAEKFENASLKELSNCTANLARVIEKTSQTDSASSMKVQFIVHVPEPRKLSNYPVIDV